MALLETVTLTLGSIIAKRMLKTWLGNSLSNDLAQLLLSKVEAKLTKELKSSGIGSSLHKLAEEIADQMKPFFKHEARHLDEGTRSAVILAVGNKLTDAEIDAQRIIDYQLDPKKLLQHLLQDQDAQTQEFPEAAELYSKLMAEFSHRITDVVTELKGYERMVDQANLFYLHEILELHRRRQVEIDKNVAIFERKYRRAIIDELGKPEHFGMVHLKRVQDLEYSCVIPSATASTFQQGEHCDVTQILNTSYRFVISGQAGLGKSTLLQWLTVCAAQDDFPNELASWKECVPFLIRLGERKNMGLPRPKDFVGPCADMFAETMPDKWVPDLLDQGKALVLIDGVDELPANQRDDMFQDLCQLVRDYPFSRYIVTSRPTAIKEMEWQQWIQKANFTEVTLHPMSWDKIDLFIDRWHKTRKEIALDPEKKIKLEVLPTSLKQLLHHRHSLRRLAINPLLCAIMCSLHEELGYDMPENRLKLYQKCVDMLFARRESESGVNHSEECPTITLKEKEFLVERFAYWMLNNDYSNVTMKQADTHLSYYLDGLHIRPDDKRPVTGETIRKLLVERINLLQEPTSGRIEFVHDTFLEYLAARAIVAESSIGILLKHIYDDRWHETIILAAGEATNSDQRKILSELLMAGVQIIQHLQSSTILDEQDYRKVCLLAVACLETITEPPEDLCKKIVESAKKLIPPKYDHEVDLIMKVGDLAIELLAFNPEHSFEEMAHCVNLLAQIGSDQAMQVIVDYAMSDAYSKSDAYQLRRAIGLAWFSFDRQRFLDQVLLKITILDLSQANINDISLLTKLTNLQSLDLSFTQINDLSRLSDLVDLRSLSLSFANGITDITPLSKLTKLESLELHSTQISNLAPVSELVNLRSLELHSTSVENISPLSGLINLQFLGLTSTYVKDVSPLSGLTNLQSLDLSFTQVEDISSLADIAGLKIVHEKSMAKTY